MKASALISRLNHLVKTHGDSEVFMDVNSHGLIPIGEVDVDADDTGIMLWAPESEVA